MTAVRNNCLALAGVVRHRSLQEQCRNLAERFALAPEVQHMNRMGQRSCLEALARMTASPEYLGQSAHSMLEHKG
jgi:hypothetical protein